MRKILKQSFHKFLGRREFAPMWEKLHKLSLKGLNYGYADSPEKSGEKNVIELLKSKKPVNGNYYILVNVGANEGQYLRLFKRMVPNYKAILFEPSSACYKKLIELKDPNVEVKNLALSDTPGSFKLFFDKEGSVVSSLIEVGNKNWELVNVDTLDNTIDSNLDIDLLVIDTEGYERNVLLGAKGLLDSRKVKMIQFEHGSEHSVLNKTFLNDFFQILKSYDIYHIKQNGIRKIKYLPEKEIFYNSNFLAILK